MLWIELATHAKTIQEKNVNKNTISPLTKGLFFANMRLFELFYETSEVCIDTRSIAKNCLFVAIKGTNFDGNDFANEALLAGAKYCISDRSTICNNVNIFYVEDTLEYLQNLALYHRKIYYSSSWNYWEQW